jgi:mannose/fructose/N-acetylgalactosamine-specific phosphotransferase system component IIC
MGCEGAQTRKRQVLADVVALRDAVQADVIGTQLLMRLDAVDPAAALAMTLGYVSTVLDGLCAAVIYLASPCCDDCADKGDADV